MNFLLAQTFLLLLASYFLGALLACVAKRAIYGDREVATAAAEPRYEAPAATYAAPVTAPPRPRPPQPPVGPRPIDPVQPRIEVLRRPDPRPMPKLVDPSRFERALIGPDPNEGMPRKAVMEIYPASLVSPTGPPHPVPKPAPPQPVVSQVLAKSGPTDATSAAAATAVALSQAAAAALLAANRSEKTVAASTSDAVPPRDVAPPHEEQHDADEFAYEADQELEAVPPPPPVQATPPPVERKRIETGDDFQRIRAINDAVEQDLKTLGVTYFEDMAGWTPDDVKRVDQALRLDGRIDREQWIEQAQILAKGGETYYSRNRPGAQKMATPAVDEIEDVEDHPVASPSGAIEDSADDLEVSETIPFEPDASDDEKEALLLSESPVEASTPEPESSATPPGAAAAIARRSVAEMAAAAAAAIAAASASVTRGLKPIEPISPLSKVDPKIKIPARLSDALKEKSAASARPESEQATPSFVQAEGAGNDLKRIRGIGVLIEKRLNGMGITSYEQIANWTSGDIDRVSQVLEFKGRIEREGWVEQARILSSGGQTEFSRRVDRGEVDTSRET